MSNLSMNLKTRETGVRQVELRAGWVFVVVTVVLSAALLLLLPGYAGPSIVVFIPTIVAVILIRLAAGKGHVRPRLFSRTAWAISLKRLLISLRLDAGQRNSE